MTPMPLHRSVIFWLGLFILSFLLWLWRDSTSHQTSYRGYPPGNESLYEFHSRDAMLVLSRKGHHFAGNRVDFRTYRLDLPPGFKRSQTDSWKVRKWFSSKAFAFYQGDTEISGMLIPTELVEHRQWSISYGCLVLLYATIWLGLSCWRSRRWVKLRKTLLLA